MCPPTDVNILLISGARIVGGAERATLQLAKALLEREHQVNAVCPAGEWQAALSGSGIAVHSAPIGGSRNLIAPFFISRAAARSRPDLLMVTTSDQWVWSCFVRRPAHTPRLVLVRHMGLPLSRRVRFLAGRRADAIVAVSPSVREMLLADSAIAPAMVHVISNSTRFAVRQSVPDSSERKHARESLGLPGGVPLIGFMGGINLGKGVEDAMVAAAQARRALGDVHLLVCGRKDTRQQTPGYEELATRHAMGGCVHYRGYLNDVIPALIASDAVVIATRSTLREGLAQTAIDAMACGVPIAGYALGGITDAVGEHDPAAVLARPDDVEDLSRVVIALLTNPELALAIAQRGLIRARQEFDPGLMTEQYEQLFSNVLRQSP